ncbi:MAG: hypothetical protein FWD57_02655, partial [Polyangiaceae bacterium]|nr:hypothetical protein [Polyangiaceae bacterium]
EMVDAGILTAEQASRHPEANKITRALGMAASVDVELRPTPMAHQKGDIFLLASDGLCDLVYPPDIASVLARVGDNVTLALACKQLVALANARGGHDNITVVLGQIVDCPPCEEARPRTVIDEDMAHYQQSQAAMPGQGYNAPVRPTLVGDADSNIGAHQATHTASTNQWDTAESTDVVGRGRSAMYFAAGYRKLIWLIGGGVLVIVGIVVVIACALTILADMSAHGSWSEHEGPVVAELRDASPTARSVGGCVGAV